MTRCQAPECRAQFVRQRMGQKACSPDCAVIVARAKRARDEAKAQRLVRRQDAAKRLTLKTRRELLAELTTAFNAFIRRRDAGKPCICCGRPFEPQRPGGSVDAGHYLSVGGAPELQFTEDNCHAQRKNCNRPGGTTRAAFRAGMIERIGLARVEALEGPHPPLKLSRDDLIALRVRYAKMARELKESQ